MVLLSVRNQLLIYTTLLTSLSFFCIFRPTTIVKQGTIMLLRDALELTDYPFTPKSLASTGLVLATLAIVYFTIYVRNDMAFLNAICPLRFLLSFGICGWSYLSKDIQIGNALVFSFAFGDVVFQVSTRARSCWHPLMSSSIGCIQH